MRSIKWVTIVIVQVGDDLKVLVAPGKKVFGSNHILADGNGKIMRVVQTLPLKVVEYDVKTR